MPTAIAVEEDDVAEFRRKQADEGEASGGLPAPADSRIGLVASPKASRKHPRAR